MVEIAIFWFQIHITNGLNFMHRKWHTGNQYMVKSAENRMRSNLELLPVINVKSRPRYISALTKSRPRYISAQKIDGKSILNTLYCNTLQKVHKGNTYYHIKGRSPSNGELSDFSFYIDSQKSARRKFKK
jgi:hypothetical protein